MLLFLHYAYYAMIHYDRRQGFWSPELSRSKAIFVLCAIETWLLGIAYIWLAGLPLKIARIPSPWFWVLPYALASVYIFSRILSAERVAHYRGVFDAWTRKKRQRWNLALIAVAVVTFAAFMASVVSLRQVVDEIR